ncbi:MAG: ABC transporter substrate-binding protein [Puniceicoccaceae bacterium]|nr:ABC transporter substrate-binding protein [Puniceicoccaceae bacterium]
MFDYLHNLLFTSALLACSVLTAEEGQREKLQGTIDAALDVIYSDCCSELTVEDKQAKVRQRIEANYDLDVIIRRAIGRNWQLMKTSEQETVLELVKKLVLKAYVDGLEGKSRPEVTLGDVTTISDTRIEIISTIHLDGKTYFVLYRLGRMASGWQIYDIVAENISVVSNYRQQIDDHFRKGNAAELIARLEELLQKNDINEDIHI